VIGAVVLAALTASAIAQSAPPPQNPAPQGGQAGSGQTVQDQSLPDNTGLDIPTNLQIFGKLDPNVRKPTAIVNDTVITGTDVDQRVALVAMANEAKLSAEDRERLKLQVLRQLIDETLQI